MVLPYGRMVRRPAARVIAVCWLVLQSAALAVAPLTMQCLHDHTEAVSCAQGHHGGHAVSHDSEHAAHAAVTHPATHDHSSDGPAMRCLCLVSESAVNALTLGTALLPEAFTLAPLSITGTPVPLELSPLAALAPLDTPPPRA